MKVLIDMNLSEDWVDFLRSSLFEALHWSTVGDGDALDLEIMEYALRFHYTVLTQDLDFGTILSSTHAKRPSVIQIRAGRVHPASLGAQVVAALHDLEARLQEGALVTVERKRTRMSVLPLKGLAR